MAAIRATGDTISHALAELDGLLGEPHGMDELLQARHDKFRQIGAWHEAGHSAG